MALTAPELPPNRSNRAQKGCDRFPDLSDLLLSPRGFRSRSRGRNADGRKRKSAKGNGRTDGPIAPRFASPGTSNSGAGREWLGAIRARCGGGQGMSNVSLALMWHQHQPYYPDDVAGENPMPWVRLHGTKDYIGMALHLEEVPEFRCTINLVPSLLVQIEAYVHGASDQHLRVSRTAGRRPVARGRALPARQLLHGLGRRDDPAPSPLSRAVYAPARLGSRIRRAGAAPVPRARPARPPGLVEPDLDAPAALREGPRAGRVQGQGPAVHRGREELAARQAARDPGRDHPAAPASSPTAARSS